MFTTLALIAAAAIAPAHATPAPTADGFAALSANHNVRTGTYCIRSGWQSATWQTGRLVRQGDCHTRADWRTRGIAFDVPTRKMPTPSVEVAAR